MGNVCLQGAHGRMRMRRGDYQSSTSAPVTTQVVGITTVWEKEKMMDSDYLCHDTVFDDDDFLENDEEDQMVVDLEVPEEMTNGKSAYDSSSGPLVSSRRDFQNLTSSFPMSTFTVGGGSRNERKRSKSTTNNHHGSGTLTPIYSDKSEPSVILQMMDVDSALMFDGRVIAPPPRQEHASLRYAAQDIARKTEETDDLPSKSSSPSAYSSKKGKSLPMTPKPRGSSLTVLALDMPKIIAGVLKHFSYGNAQRLSRVSRKWREAASSVLSKQNVVITLCWDWGGREWSIAAFPVEEYLLDDTRVDPAVLKGKTPKKIGGISRQGSSYDSDEEDEDAGFCERIPIFDGPVASLAPPTKVTVYRPVTFNMEDNSPGPLPIRITEVTQIRVTPLAMGPAKAFHLCWGSTTEKSQGPSTLMGDVDTPQAAGRKRYERTDSAFCGSDDDDEIEKGLGGSVIASLHSASSNLAAVVEEGSDSSTVMLLNQACVKGRLQSRRDRQVFSDSLFGPDFGLMLTPSGSGIERLYIVGGVSGTNPKPAPRAAPRVPMGSSSLASHMLWTSSSTGGCEEFVDDVNVNDVWNGPQSYSAAVLKVEDDDSSDADPVSDSNSFEGGKTQIQQQIQLVSKTRWDRLVWAQKSIGCSMDQIYSIKDTVAMRFYLSCSDSDQLWAFRQVVETLIDPVDPERGHIELSECMSKLDRIAYRVDILSQLGIHGNQKAERLRSYFKEGCRLWRSIRGGDLSLRVSGFHQYLANTSSSEEATYRHLANVIVPCFSGDA
ncbi:hypothetical protein HDU67_010027 [Dinochytrium kinnereticum]|nr:hypothetical protein HDU67_010027 [Dinochytrium kinnereticum]